MNTSIKMSVSDKKFVAKIETMTLGEARAALASGVFGNPGSNNHSFASSWISVKEAKKRDEREETMISLTRSAKTIATAAMIIAIIASIIAIIGIIK
jgi:hypothetical protein